MTAPDPAAELEQARRELLNRIEGHRVSTWPVSLLRAITLVIDVGTGCQHCTTGGHPAPAPNLAVVTEDSRITNPHKRNRCGRPSPSQGRPCLKRVYGGGPCHLHADQPPTLTAVNRA